MTAYTQSYHGHDIYRGHVNYHDHGSLSIPLPQELGNRVDVKVVVVSLDLGQAGQGQGVVRVDGKGGLEVLRTIPYNHV